MIKLADPVLILYIVASVLGFFLRFVKDASWKQLSWGTLVQRLPAFACVIVPLGAIFILGQQFGVAAGTTLPYFLAASFSYYILSSINLPSYLRGIILLAGSVVLTLCGSAPETLIAIASSLLGLFASKLTDNLLFASDSSFDDVLPPFIWLTGVAWINTVDSGEALTLHASILLGIMSVSLFMRFVQGPFVSFNRDDDKIYLKRVMLSTTAGLLILCVLVKLLNAVNMQPLALICGAGYFMTYLLKNLDGDKRYVLSSQQSVKLLILIGILTLVATRFYGNFGLLALSPVAMVAPISSTALFAGLFWASRVLLQVFIQNFNSNVTGINLMHPYTGAAMYAGFLLAVVLFMLLREISDRRVLLTIILGTGILTPIMSNYILHAEPTCSLLVSATVALVLLAVVAPTLQNKPAPGAENLLLLPGLMISSGILTHGLLEAGIESTIALKTSVLGYSIAFVLVLMLVYWWTARRNAGKPVSANRA